MMAKVLSTCIAEDLVQATKTCNLLPSNHFTCHPRRTTSDSLHYVITFVKNALRKEVVSALFLNIKGTFPNVVLSQLIHNMRNWGVLSQYTDFIACKVNGRQMMHKFDGYKSEPLTMTKCIDQGCPLSGIAYQFYNTDLVDIHDAENGENAVAFMDYILLLVWAKTLIESNTKSQADDGDKQWQP